jgi:hypothetical protein
VQRHANPDNSCTQNNRVAAHQPLEACVQTAILYRFGDLLGGNHVLLAEIRDRDAPLRLPGA